MIDFLEVKEQINEYTTELQNTLDQDHERKWLQSKFNKPIWFFYRGWDTALQPDQADSLALLAAHASRFAEEWGPDSHHLGVELT